MLPVTRGRVQDVMRITEQLRQLQVGLEQQREVIRAHLLRLQCREVGRAKDGGGARPTGPEPLTETYRHVAVTHVAGWELSAHTR